jgi:hypothetical protein
MIPPPARVRVQAPPSTTTKGSPSPPPGRLPVGTTSRIDNQVMLGYTPFFKKNNNFRRMWNQIELPVIKKMCVYIEAKPPNSIFSAFKFIYSLLSKNQFMYESMYEEE